MPTYAVLGATGQVGTSLLTVLLNQQHPDLKINAYCRSASKLHNALLQTQDNPAVTVYPGAITDTALLASTLRGTQAAFLAVAATQNEPGCSIAQDTAHAVIAALELLRKEGEKKLPLLVVLSSASIDRRFIRNIPWPLHSILYTALSSLYRDLELAEAYLLSHSNWVHAVFVKPAALTHDVQGGHKLSVDESKSPLSFLDLAAGMVEVAGGGSDEWAGRSVSVLPMAKKVAFPWDAPVALGKGLLLHFLPWLWGWI